MNFVEQVGNALKAGGHQPGTALVAGVSGGADSVALLRSFHALGIPVTVAHLNHQLRGADSDADEQFVRALADELKFPMVGRSCNVKKLAADNGWSLEMAARQARHGVFGAVADGGMVALAHNADDQAETFLLKLARGAGPDGLSGMPAFQPLDNFSVIRPMLGIYRTEIIQWLEATGFGWREDASNRDDAFLRNRVRHEILPMLGTRLNPDIKNTILRTMDVLRAENEWMDGMLDGFTLDTDQPMALQRRLLRKWLFEQGADNVTFGAIDKILSLIASGNGTTTFELNDRQRVVVEYGTPRFEHVEQTFQSARGRQECLPHNPAWKLHFEFGAGWKKDHGRGAGILPAEASFNADKVGDAPIKARCFRPGDRMNPLGMEGSRKLQDIFTDQKIPRAQRVEIPVVECRGEIIWIPGYRTARSWEVRGTDGKAVHVRIEHI
ncbi:MAG: tRNA lysidine(34) synthetase TilS [Kiritimatiellales bacterium]|nr:tRNA lysidine(34) synthetase TilS [Kiritimatiellales bacterium]